MASYTQKQCWPGMAEIVLLPGSVPRAKNSERSLFRLRQKAPTHRVGTRCHPDVSLHNQFTNPNRDGLQQPARPPGSITKARRNSGLAAKPKQAPHASSASASPIRTCTKKTSRPSNSSLIGANAWASETPCNPPRLTSNSGVEPRYNQCPIPYIYHVQPPRSRLL